MTETPNITHPDVPVPDCGRADDWDPGWKWEEGETRDCRLIYSRERTIDDEARVHVDPIFRRPIETGGDPAPATSGTWTRCS